MTDLHKQKEELLIIIKEKNYISVRISIFEQLYREWDTVIDYDNIKKIYSVYLTMDRASKGKVFEFDTFDEAKNKFLELIENTIFRYNYYKENNMPVPYPSPLWDTK